MLLGWLLTALCLVADSSRGVGATGKRAASSAVQWTMNAKVPPTVSPVDAALLACGLVLVRTFRVACS